MKFGAAFASGLRRRRARPGDKWHLDEVLLKICGKRHWLWRRSISTASCWTYWFSRGVINRRPNASFGRLLTESAMNRVVITDKLASYPPAIRKVLPNTEHRRHKRLNNRAENSHLPTRKRERVLQRFKSAEHAQRFLGPFSAVSDHFRPRRHRACSSAVPRSIPNSHQGTVRHHNGRQTGSRLSHSSSASDRACPDAPPQL
jgi:putative transposase